MIDDHDMEYLRSVFVDTETYNKDKLEINGKLGNDKARFAGIEARLKAIEWMCGTTVAGVVGIFLRMVSQAGG